MKHILQFIFVLFASTTYAQSLQPQVISSMGGHSAPDGGPQLSYNLGETFTATLSGGSSKLTQGFEQVFKPGAITGTFTVCATATTALANNMAGGVWTSSNTGIATIGSATGVASGVAGGTAVITYSLPDGIATAVLTVTPLPNAGTITGASSVTVGATISLANAASGGVWSSSNTGIATVGSTGVVTGAAVGTATISYTVTNACGTANAAKTVTVNASLSTPITGTLTVCAGSTTDLDNATTGGTWSSSNTAVATVNASNGIVTGVAAGTATITYTLAGAYVTAEVTVNPLPDVITGASSVCVSATTTLASATSEGTWSSSNTGIATITSGGVVTGAAAGTATITYMLGTGCYRTKGVTVNPLPSAITGALSVCVGATGSVSSATGGGVSWMSGNTSVATIGSTSGVVTGVSAGTSEITYTVSTGCQVKATVTVSGLPDAIAGPSFVCHGSAISLSSASSGGTWASSNTAVGTIGTSGLLSGIAAGTTTITYTLATGCKTTTVITVGFMPAVITGTTGICTGGAVTLSSATPGGTWSSTNLSASTIGSSTGIVTGTGTGTTTISYLYTSGCARTAVVTVSAGPGANTGNATVCVAGTTTLANATSGGTWASSMTSKASVNITTGVVTGASAGTANITYTVSAGCYSITQVTVDAPLATNIAGATGICAGATTTFTHTTPGGVWTSSNTSLATVGSASGVITGISAGTPVITYTVGSCYKTKSITITGGGVSITGNQNVCVGSTTVLSCAMSGGTGWTSSNTAVGTIGATNGVVGGIAAGTASVTYTASTGCTAVAEVTVSALPTAISGTLTVCAGATTTLASVGTTGGTWLSTTMSKATIGSTTGVVTGVASGTSVITYTWTNTCKRTAVATVNAAPAATGFALVSPSTSYAVSTASPQLYITVNAAAPGGTWTSSNNTLATVAGTGSITATVTKGTGTGALTISYTLTNSCGSTVSTRSVTANARGGASTTGNAGDAVAFTVYPNPNAGVLTVQAQVKGVFSVYTIDGKALMSAEIKEAVTTIELPNTIANGIYMCRFNGDDGSTIAVRLVVER